MDKSFPCPVHEASAPFNAPVLPFPKPSSALNLELRDGIAGYGVKPPVEPPKNKRL